MTAIVLGNGQSRRGIELAHLRRLGSVYGCNALYRDFRPDVLVATDRPISTEIQSTGYARNHRFYTRRPLPQTGALSLPRNYHGFSSGPAAVGLAAIDGHDSIYLLGFDMGPSASGGFNNMYADTEFYKKSIDGPTFTGNWVRQLVTIARDFPKATFIRVMGDVTVDHAQLAECENWQNLPIAAFLDLINKP